MTAPAPRPLVFVARDFKLSVDAAVSEAARKISRYQLHDSKEDSPEQGHIFRDTVRRFVDRAARFVAYVDKNNLNVAFEIGYAFGRQVPVKLICKSKCGQNDHWTKRLLTHYLAPQVEDSDGLVELIESDLDWLECPRSDGESSRTGRTLLLCPTRGEGKDLRNALDFAVDREWEWGTRNLPQHLDQLVSAAAADDVVWIIPDDEHETGPPDGVETTANALVAGYAAALGVPLAVYCHRQNRDLADLDGVIGFSNPEELPRLVKQRGRAPALRRSPATESAATLVGILDRHFPTPEQFASIAEGFAAPYVRGTTPREQWLCLLEHCAARNEVEWLLERARQRAESEDRADNGRRLNELRSELSGMHAMVPRNPVLGGEWAMMHSVRARLEEIASPVDQIPRLSGARPAASPTTVFARSALLLTWGPGKPIPPALCEIEAWLDSQPPGGRTMLEAVREAGWLSRGNDWAEPHLGEAFGAFALVADCERDPASGLGLVRWMLDHLHHLGPVRRQILGLVLRWWPPACEAAVAWQAEALRKDPRGGTPRGHRDVLLQLTRCDALLAQIGAAPWADPALAVPGTRPACAPAAAANLSNDLAPSVAWALRSGQERYVPYVLESLGETRTSVYSALLARVVLPAAKFALARALCRLARDAVDEPVLPGDAWGDAIRASVPRYGPAARRRLQIPSVAALWLEIVDLPYSDDDLRELAGLFHAFAGSVLGVRARGRLALEPQMRRAWTALGPGRRPFVLQLNDTQLCLPNLAALVHEVLEHPPSDPVERADAELLIARHKDRCAEQ